MKFLNLIVDHARATLSIMLLVLVAGTIARIALPVEVNPNVTLPLVMIMVRHDGISPEDGTRLLIRPIEKELKTLDGLEEINAVAREVRPDTAHSPVLLEVIPLPLSEKGLSV